MEVVLYDDKGHKYVLIGFADSKDENSIPSNQYLITQGKTAALLDPGGFGLFPVLISRVLKHTAIENIEAIILSHQDPDVNGGLNIWEEITKAKIYISRLWTRFLPHYELKGAANIVPVEDEGAEIHLSSNLTLKIIPAHFLHSPGHINVYDPVAKILFSGDIGASVLPCSNNQLFVEDFDAFLPCIEGFHKRYMSSNKALRMWIKAIENLDINIIAPQHGYLYKGETIDKFIKWLYDLKCGVDIL
ncbi:metallo-beta-lactamase family protein [Candidatus Omnitrophus magneticus]|uniref:Metallo-beta-lactamase family protein n=1 Tax=Candidatus Omnitrophus magneticus TaxID=1609969 RepID=A0A0F0CVQ1_9BACT|nr:metallo-beta-lactamase family protein [Candidatus Omnitrophus magneticus]